MATVVQIELQVDEKGAVTGVHSLDSSLKTASTTTKQLNADMSAAGAQAEKTTAAMKVQADSAVAFSVRMKAALAAYKEQSERGLEVQTMLRKEFDKLSASNSAVAAYEKAAAAAAAYVPAADAATTATVRFAGASAEARIAAGALMGSNRAMAMGLANLASKSQALAPLFAAAMPVAIGVAAIGIIAQLGEEVYNLYEKWLDVDSAIEKFNDKATEAASKRFYESAGIDELNADLQQASAQIDQLNQKRATSPGWFKEWAGTWNMKMYGPLGENDPNYFGMRGANQLNQSQGRSDEDRLKLLDETHARNLQLARDAAQITEAQLIGIAKERAAQTASDKEAEDEQKYKIQRQQILHEITSRPGKLKPGDAGYVPPVSAPAANAYQAETDEAKQHAAAQFQAREIETERTITEERIRLHNEAVDAGLRGEALYYAKTVQQIEDLTRRGVASPAVISEAWAKYHAEEKKRQEEQDRQVGKMHEQTQLAGLTGVARVKQEGRNRVNDIYNDPNSTLNPGQRLAEAHEIDKQTAQQIAELNKSFAERVNEIVDQSSSRELKGFNRISAEAQRQIHALEQEYKDKGGRPEDLARGESAITTSANDQASELAQRNADETARIEAAAHAHSLNAEKQKTAAIEAEYQARLEKYREEVAQEGLSRTDFNKRVAAAAQERDADMEQAARQAREKMAGEFDSFFKSLDHPTEALKNLGDKVAGEAAAALMQKIQQHGQGASATPATPEGGIVGVLTGSFGGLFGGRKSKSMPGATVDAKAELPHAPGVSAAHDKVFSVAQATIHIGSATFAGGGMGAPGAAATANPLSSTVSVPGGPAMASPAWAAPSSSTSLLAPSRTSFRPAHTGESLPAWSGASGVAGSAPPGGVSVNGSAIPTGGMVGGSFPPGGNSFSGGGGGAAGGGGSSSDSGGAWGDSGTTPSDVPSSARANFNAGSGAPPPPRQNKVMGALGGAEQAFGLFKQTKGIFGSKAVSQDQVAETQSPSLDGTLNADGTFTSASQSGFGKSMLGGGGIGANAMGAVGGALGMYSAVEGNGGLGGAASGAMSGMQLGMALGGPIGAGIGAAAGAIVGAIGFGGREKARVYDLKQVRPRLSNDIDGLQQGSMDYLSAYSDIESLSREANMTTNAMGPAARSYYQDTIKSEIKQAEGKLSNEERAGRSDYTTSAAQYDIGADSIPRSGMAVIHAGERIIPSDQNKQITQALKTGSSLESLHRAYQTSMSTRDARQTASGGGQRTMNMNVHAIDSKGVAQFFDKYKHHMRAALNASYAENSGGADA